MSGGEIIGFRDGKLQVPAEPVILFIEGDGSGPDIWRATRRVMEAAVEAFYGGRRRIHWREILAGEKAKSQTGEYLPSQTIDELGRYRVCLKGPLSTPVGGGIRSLNVSIRQILDLYACVRPVRWFCGVPSPVRHPERVEMVIFRENTEDVYAGLEWAGGTPQAESLTRFLEGELGVKVGAGAGLGLKPISPAASKRLVRAAIRYCLQHDLKSVTLVHKGNIMKYTEGAFRDWGYQVAREEFADLTVTEAEVGSGTVPQGKILIKDRITDNMFQQVMLRPEEYDVIATTNLNGDYLSDALAAQVGGLGMAPGANLSDECAIFEATHGTAPKYAGMDKVNPGSLILSGVMLLEHLGWDAAAAGIIRAMEDTISEGTVTYDLARQMEGAKEVSTSGFAQAIVGKLQNAGLGPR